MEADQVLHQQMPTTYRQLQPQINHGLQHGQPQLSHQNLSQNGIDLSGLDNEAVFQQLQNASHSHVYHTANQYNPNHAQQHMHQQATASPHTPQQQTSSHQYPVLAPGPIQNNAIQRLQGDNIFGSPDESDQKSVGHLNLKIVLDAPNLEEWRNKLFNVDEMITLSEEEYQTYFTYVDNVYSHRSTQRYKRKPFVSHYWDCRLKGRPPGTPKSEDPNKKKRKRTARERDLCDVKIKVTEYFPGAMLRQDFVPDGDEYGANPQVQLQGHGQTGTYLSTASDGGVSAHPGSTGRRYYTIQRVNGNGGNGKGDGVAGPHKHTLEESDRVKKNSVQRHLIQKEKDEKRTLKTFHKKASGAAAITVRKHAKEQDLKFYATCCNPWAQRVWIALEVKSIPYQYVEVDPFRKPPSLLEVIPAGPVPGIRHGDWGCGESGILIDYLEDLGIGEELLPKDPKQRAKSRFWADHVNKNVIPAFYTVLTFQPPDRHAAAIKTLQNEIQKLVQASHIVGPFFLGVRLSYVDCHFAPWVLRLSRILKKFREWPDPEPGSRWARWVEAIETHDFVRNTTSEDALYEESYERWIQGKPPVGVVGAPVDGGNGTGYGLP